MTVEELYKSALAVMPSNPSEDDSLRQYMAQWTNLLLRETLKYENAHRALRGEAELTTAPSVSTLADAVPYSAQLSENAFVWGIASLMAKDDDDTLHEQDYRGRYINACAEYAPMILGTVADVYGEGNDA